MSALNGYFFVTFECVIKLSLPHPHAAFGDRKGVILWRSYDFINVCRITGRAVGRVNKMVRGLSSVVALMTDDARNHRSHFGGCLSKMAALLLLLVVSGQRTTKVVTNLSLASMLCHRDIHCCVIVLSSDVIFCVTWTKAAFRKKT